MCRAAKSKVRILGGCSRIANHRLCRILPTMSSVDASCCSTKRPTKAKPTAAANAQLQASGLSLPKVKLNRVIRTHVPSGTLNASARKNYSDPPHSNEALGKPLKDHLASPQTCALVRYGASEKQEAREEEHGCVFIEGTLSWGFRGKPKEQIWVGLL